MKDFNLAVLVDAKTEYTNQLTNLCKGRIYMCIKEMFNSAKIECESNDKKQNTLVLFQNKLAEIPKWSTEMIKNEYDKLTFVSQCDWLHELLTAVFISHSRILSSVNSEPKTKLDLDIPNFQDFLHNCYIDVARCFWKSPYLFDDTVTSYDFQRNRRDCELMIEKSIGESIRKQLPVKHILKNYLGENFKQTTNQTVENDVNEEERENLKKMIQKDIEPEEETEAKEEKDTESENKDNVEIEVIDAELEPKEVSESDEVESQSKEITPLNVLDELTLLEEDMGDNLNLELDGLTDLTDSLQDEGVVYGLLNEEEPNQTVEQAVTEELQNIIENQDKDVKKVLINEEPFENVTVTKINKDPEYNFFSDATQHYVE